jgi:hypothetical protein
MWLSGPGGPGRRAVNQNQLGPEDPTRVLPVSGVQSYSRTCIIIAHARYSRVKRHVQRDRLMTPAWHSVR